MVKRIKQVGPDWRLAKRAFRWLLCCTRPLTLRELAVAAAIDADSESSFKDEQKLDYEESVLEVCGSFITFDKQTHVVSFGHQSVREYFSNRFADGSVSPHSIDELQANRYILKACLKYLVSQPKRFNAPCSRYVFRSARQDRAAEDTVPDDHHPFLRYCAFQWPEHAMRHGVTEDLRTFNTVLTFLRGGSKTYQAWSNLYQHFNEVEPISRTYETRELTDVPNGVYYCALFGLDRILTALPIERYDVNHIGGRWNHAIFAAIRNTNCDALRVLLEAGAYVDVGIDDGREFELDNIFDFSLGLLSAKDTELIDVGMLLLEVDAPVDAVLDECVDALGRWLFESESARLFPYKVANRDLGEDADIGEVFWWHLRRNINIRNSRGRTALHVAVLRAEGLEAESVVKFLLRNNADGDAIDEDGFTALHYAVADVQKGLVQLLLDAGVNVNVQAACRLAALHRAVQSDVLLEAGEGKFIHDPGKC
jgi:Ankyrin repeats (3 copies)